MTFPDVAVRITQTSVSKLSALTWYFVLEIGATGYFSKGVGLKVKDFMNFKFRMVLHKKSSSNKNDYTEHLDFRKVNANKTCDKGNGIFLLRFLFMALLYLILE